MSDAAPTPRRRHANATPTPRQRHANATPTPRRRHADATPTPRRRHSDSFAILAILAILAIATPTRRVVCQVVAKNARAVSFGNTPKMDELTAELEPTYRIYRPATTKRIAQALELKIIGRMIELHAKLRSERGQPFTVSAHYHSLHGSLVTREGERGICVFDGKLADGGP